MNASRGLLKYGYSLCSKDLFVHPGTSRILYNCILERNYSVPRSNKTVTNLPQPIAFRQLSVNSSLVALNHRYFSTSIRFNNQVALKSKSPDHKEDEQKETKRADKSTDGRKVESQPNDKIEHATESVKESGEKLSLTAKFKKMYKEYWYVLLPVHVVTSCFWFGSFYYLSSSGVDIPALLESMHFNETMVAKLRDSSLGHAAIAYLCYKIVTPVRYTVTLGGTTLSIKYLSQWGYIRPVPTKEKLKQMYDDRKAKFGKKE